MAKELAKTYDPKGLEDRIYQTWEEKNYFHAEVDRSRKPFTIVIPPPNITGILHLGHAFDNTVQDILIRFKRMQGFNTLWQPGTDHASISTEVRIIQELQKEGIQKEDLGREGFLKRAWEWKEEYGGTIVKQLRKLGSSCDWERERFTMDEGCNRAVTEVFLRMHEKGYIYRGSRIINWCPVCNTSISDAEVEYEEQNGHLWHIKYPLVEEDGSISKTRFLEFATTRPETMLGDTAVAVHPEDERYADLIGKEVFLPFVERRIPVVADEYVDREFGTGVVKITPGHDPNDFEVGKRHHLPEVNIMNDDATINENGAKFAGMERYAARKQIVKELEEMGLLVRVEDYTHNVGTHERCHTTVEPLIKKQWFVKMDDLIKPAAEAVRNGTIKLIPPRLNAMYFNWTDNIRDWCISRQLWWGHRIPAYYCDDCEEVTVAAETPDKCPHCGGTHFTQDPDTLDTWFSSALWPFETLGWPDKTEDLDYFFPTDVLVTGYDIIFFWVIRMIFSSYEQMGTYPFHTVMLHGLIRDSEGRKFSKSLGNGIDPLEVIEQYGADALRLTIITGNSPGNDMRFYFERVENSRNFANKVWNASRFILMNMEKAAEGGEDVRYFLDTKLPEGLEAADHWILSRMNDMVREVTENMEKFELGIAVGKVYDFIWDEFCDWYIEMVKPRLRSADAKDGSQTCAKEDAADAAHTSRPQIPQAESDAQAHHAPSHIAALWTLQTVLITSLKMLHPYMPFVTEEIYQTFVGDAGSAERSRFAESIMISDWPLYDEALCFAEDEREISLIKEAVRGIRNLRSEMNVAPSKKTKVFVVSENEATRSVFEKSRLFFETLSHASESVCQTDKTGIADDAASVVLADAVIYIPLSELVDISAEIERLTKEKERLEKELARSKGMLANEKFLSKAPPEKIAEEKEKQQKYEQTYAQVQERLSALQ
ncbi:MAG: valine--tRNA ligase [Lachnospiraceae bacterium]|nr:valine--tRNA ligase [Lachnospiraceae bacterium]